MLNYNGWVALSLGYWLAFQSQWICRPCLFEFSFNAALSTVQCLLRSQKGQENDETQHILTLYFFSCSHFLFMSRGGVVESSPGSTYLSGPWPLLGLHTQKSSHGHQNLKFIHLLQPSQILENIYNLVYWVKIFLQTFFNFFSRVATVLGLIREHLAYLAPSMGDRHGSGVKEPPCTSLQAEDVALPEEVEVDLEVQHWGKTDSKESFHDLEMVWYEENRAKAEHGVTWSSIYYHQVLGKAKPPTDILRSGWS